MKTTGIRASFIAASVVFMAGTGVANAVMLYDEFTDGDLGNSPGGVQGRTLVLGENTITGNAGRGGNDATIDYDDINLSLPDELTITSWELEWTIFPEGLGAMTIDYSLGGMTIDNLNLLGGSSTMDLFALASKFITDNYYLLDMSDLVIDPADSGGLFSYTMTITTVPLPPAAWLLISGLLGFAAIRRRS